MNDLGLLKPIQTRLFCPKCGEGKAIATERCILCLKCGDKHALQFENAASMLLSEPTVRPPENAELPAKRKRHPIYGLNEPPRVVWPEASEQRKKPNPAAGVACSAAAKVEARSA